MHPRQSGPTAARLTGRFAQVGILLVAGGLTTSLTTTPLATAQTNDSTAGACTYPLFIPPVAGATLTYQDASSASGTITYTITNVSPNTFDEHTSYQTAVSGSQGGVARVSDDQTDSFRCDTAGLAQTSHQENGTYTDGSTATVTFHDYTGVILPRTVSSGTTWDYSFVQDQVTSDGTAEEHYSDHVVASGPESVTVAAGTFQAFRMDHMATDTPLNYTDDVHQTQWTEWVAPGVGPVKTPNRELVAYTAGAAQDCSAQGAESRAQAMQDLAAIQAQEDAIDVPVDATPAEGGMLTVAQAPISPRDLSSAFQQAGLAGDRVQTFVKDGLLRYVIRLAPDGRPLLSAPAINNLIATTCIQPNSLQGAHDLLVGAVQQSADQIRVTGRTVDVATGEITAAAVADGSSTTLATTLASALARLPIDLTP